MRKKKKTNGMEEDNPFTRTSTSAITFKVNLHRSRIKKLKGNTIKSKTHIT